MIAKIESWNFQHLFDLEFCETLQNFSSFRWHSFMGNTSCLNELKFCEVSWNYKSKRCWKFQISTLTKKNVLFLKKSIKRTTMYNEYLVLFSVNRWPLDVLSFLIHGFGINKVQSGTNVCSWKFLSKKDCEGVTNQFWAVYKKV